MKPLLLALALALAPVLQGCMPSTVPSRAMGAAETHGIPFHAATVIHDAGSGVYRIDWQAPGVRRVTVFAGASPDSIDRSRPVASGEAGAAITVGGLDPGHRWYFALVPDRGAELVVAERSLRLETAPNLRDAGGYRSADGRWVRMGIVYRSDQLDRLDDGDLARLAALDLGTVVDLRTRTEREREPDRMPAGADHVVLDVAADAAGSVGGDMRQAMSMIAAGRGAELLTTANRDFVIQPSARSAYAGLLTRIATQDRGLLYHCTAGKDRTGWASAVLLSLLGVPRETVMQDYLASNVYLAEKNRATLAAVARSGTAMDPAHLETVMTVRASYIEAAFAEVDRRHGSMEAYAHDALGIDAEALERLRARMLVGGLPVFDIPPLTRAASAASMPSVRAP